MSLKAALEILLGGACYHMIECFGHPDHPAQWHAGIRGDAVDWDALLAGYVAAVDWPSAACWKELADHYPDALILHSERPADDWFRSADATIFEGLDKPLTPDDVRDGRWMGMAKAMLTERFTPDYLDRDAAIAAFEAWRHCARRPVADLEHRRRLGTYLRGAGAPRAGGTVPPQEHDSRVPRDERPRRVRVSRASCQPRPLSRSQPACRLVDGQAGRPWRRRVPRVVDC
jgi:hypothetical protein